MTVDKTVLAAWQVALHAEQRAAFGYTVIGPHLPAERQDLARSCQALHEQLRDATAAMIAAAGAAPAAAQSDYPDLYGPDPLKVAALLEDGCASAWRWFYTALAQVPPNRSMRAAAQRGLTGSAVRATRWRLLSGAVHAAVAFPGTAAQK